MGIAMRGKIIAALALLAASVVAFLFLRQPAPPPPERLLAIYEKKFHCTLYYTPREAGFTAERGFDVTPETRHGLHGSQFPRDFLLCVEEEGHGRLKRPVGGKFYIRYWSGTWGFADQPLDHNQHPLLARQTCAVSAKQTLLAPRTKLRITPRG